MIRSISRLTMFRICGVLLLAVGSMVAAGASNDAAAPKRMALTVDDLPVVSSYSDPATHRSITDGLLATFAEADVPVIGFVNENKLLTDGELDPERVALLERWLEAGLELGNHGYAHLDLHRVGAQAFEEDVLRGEVVLRELLGRRGARPRYFRHPYLHTGRDAETRRSVESFLEEHGYRIAPVTVDNSDWIFARAYDRAHDRADAEAEQRISHAYLDYMMAKVAYFESNAQELFDRPIRQVLLVHANRLNAEHLGGLIARLRADGYAFVSLDEALEDEAYRSEEGHFGAGGISWLHRWALARDVDRSLFEDEPRTPELVMQEAGVESE